MSAPLGYSQITSINTAKGLGDGTLTPIPPLTQYALVSVEAQAIRWRDDKVLPTATVGFLVPAGTIFRIDGDLNDWKCIAASAGAIVNVAFYKSGPLN